MRRTVSMWVLILIALAACGDDDTGLDDEATASTVTVSTSADPPASTTIGAEESTTTSAETITTTSGTTSTEATTTTARTGTRSFCEVNAEGETLDPYRGTPAEMEADLARARELGPEFLASAPSEIEAELNIIIPIFLDVLDYVESTGYDQSAVDFDYIQAEFYASDEAQAAGMAIDAYVAENC